MDLLGTPFQLQVWQVLSDISYGEASTHQQVAETIGRPKAVRAVLDAISKIRFRSLFPVTASAAKTEPW